MKIAERHATNKQNERKNVCIKILQQNYYENDTTINNHDIRNINE